MLSPATEYFERVRRIWVKSVAGPLAAVGALILSIAGLVFHVSPDLTVWLGVALVLIAILLTWPAQYAVWNEEHQRLEKELGVARERIEKELSQERAQLEKAVSMERERREKEVAEEREKREAAEFFQSKPEITGELHGFRLSGSPAERRTGNVWKCFASAACKLYLCNAKAMKTTLKELIVDGSALDPPAEFAPATFIRGADKVLEQGIGVNAEVLLTYTFRGLQWKDIGRVDLKNIKVHAVDSFGTKHPITVPPGESLPTP